MFYFLDVDGVLNRESDWRIPFTVNEECLKNFVMLIKKDSDPHIVLSSTWRVGFTNTGVMSSGGNSLADKLAAYGIRIEAFTPVSNKTRQEEIEFYIRRNNVTEYLVLDDDASLFPWPERLHLYLTDYKTGLTDKDIRKIYRLCKQRR